MKVQFFSPHSDVDVHAIPESYLVKEINTHDIDVSYITCDEVFSTYCVCMSSIAISKDDSQEKRQKVCLSCKNKSQSLIESTGAFSYALSKYLHADDYLHVEGIIRSIDRHDFKDFSYEGVSVGRIALYELLLKYKKMTLNFNEEEWDWYLTYVNNSLLSLIAFMRIYTIDRPDILITYSPQYCVNGVCAEYMTQQKKKVYFIEGSSSNSERYSALRIWDWDVYGLTNPALKFWKEKKNNVTIEDLSRVKGHFEVLLTAKSHAVYSSAYTGQFEIYKHFDISKEKKIVLATLSSFDEAYAAYEIGKFPQSKVKSSVFDDQFSWIKKTIELIKNRDDIFLIIRVHPRDFPNKRDNRQSEQAIIWLELFKNLPPNIAIDYPQDNISLYDILTDVDVLLTGWSATAIEALAHCVPVVTYDENLPSYPSDIHFTGKTEEEYIANIDKALIAGRHEGLAIDAYKWMAFSFSLGVIRTPKLNLVNTSKNIFFRIYKKLFLSYMYSKDMKNRLVNKNDINKFMFLLKNTKSSLYEELESNKKEDNNLDEYIINELLPLVMKK